MNSETFCHEQPVTCGYSDDRKAVMLIRGLGGEVWQVTFELQEERVHQYPRAKKPAFRVSKERLDLNRPASEEELRVTTSLFYVAQNLAEEEILKAQSK